MLAETQICLLHFFQERVLWLSAHVVTLSLTTKDLLRSSKISELFPTFLQRIFALFFNSCSKKWHWALLQLYLKLSRAWQVCPTTVRICKVTWDQLIKEQGSPQQPRLSSDHLSSARLRSNQLSSITGKVLPHRQGSPPQ